MDADTYLGDGVYIGRDGLTFCIYTGDHREMLADNRVFLEPEVTQELLRYIHQAIKKEAEANG